LGNKYLGNKYLGNKYLGNKYLGNKYLEGTLSKIEGPVPEIANVSQM
jgi:hypothetical protein